MDVSFAVVVVFPCVDRQTTTTMSTLSLTTFFCIFSITRSSFTSIFLLQIFVSFCIAFRRFAFRWLFFYRFFLLENDFRFFFFAFCFHHFAQRKIKRNGNEKCFTLSHLCLSHCPALFVGHCCLSPLKFHFRILCSIEHVTVSGVDVFMSQQNEVKNKRIHEAMEYVRLRIKWQWKLQKTLNNFIYIVACFFFHYDFLWNILFVHLSHSNNFFGAFCSSWERTKLKAHEKRESN